MYLYTSIAWYLSKSYPLYDRAALHNQGVLYLLINFLCHLSPELSRYVCIIEGRFAIAI